MQGNTRGVDAATVAAVKRALQPVVVRAHLDEKGEGAVVGSAGQANACPLATMLHERLGLSTCVGRYQVLIYWDGANLGGDSMIDVEDLDPAFIRDFVATLDRRYPATSDPVTYQRVYRPVTAGEALAVLDEVVPR